jgi:hypothetical protein
LANSGLARVMADGNAKDYRAIDVIAETANVDTAKRILKYLLREKVLSNTDYRPPGRRKDTKRITVNDGIAQEFLSELTDPGSCNVHGEF